MKEIVIERMTLTNFRGIKNLTVLLGGQSTEISGANATGKSTLLNAYLWCLWGIDQEGRKDFNLKPLDQEGNSTDKVDVSVELTLLGVEEKPVTLRRTLRENWVKPNGETEEVYKGNTTIYEIDDVPTKMSEYNSYIAAILPEGTPDGLMQLLSTPDGIPTMDWKALRKLLLDTTGGVDETELIASREEYKELMREVGDTPLERAETQWKATKSKLQKELKEYQPRIDQTAAMKPAEQDWAEIEGRIAELDKDLGTYSAQVTKATETANAAYLEEDLSRQRLTQIATDIARLEADRERAKNRTKIDAENKVEELKARTHKTLLREGDAKRALERAEGDITDLRKRIETEERRAEELREDWRKLKREEFPADKTTCPTCGQPLPQDELGKRMLAFEAKKQADLARISEDGRSKNEEIELLKRKLDSLIVEKEARHEALMEVSAEVEQSRTEVERAQYEADETDSENPRDTAEADAITDKIQALKDEEAEIKERLNAKLTEKEEETNLAEVKQKQVAAMAERDELKRRLSDRETIKRYDDEIKRLEELAKKKGQEMADVERWLSLTQSYRMSYIRRLEESINDLFSGGITFRMYDFTLDGNPVETCTPLVDGTPYQTINTARRINAGIQIANCISRAYDISVPMWVDGAESVNSVHMAKGQAIILRVSDSPELMISSSEELTPQPISDAIRVGLKPFPSRDFTVSQSRFTHYK